MLMTPSGSLLSLAKAGQAFQNLVDAFATHTLCWRVDLAFIKADSTP